MSALKDFFNALASYTWWVKAKTEPKRAPKQGALKTLNGLPAELILLISKFLRPADLLCLSLCSCWISTILDEERRSLRYHVPAWRIPLLYRLDRDLPDHFVCHECCFLHKYDESQDFGLPHPYDFRLSHQCIGVLGDMSEHRELLLHKTRSDPVAYRFVFVHLQLAMKRFHYGPVAGISTDSLFTIEVMPTPWATTLFSCEAQICCQPPALQLRVQDIVLFHSDLRIEWSEDTIGHFLICRHQQNPELVLLMHRLASQFYDEKKEGIYSNYCGWCDTEYVIELRVLNGQLAFVITRWIDLGSGLTPLDPRWTVHARLIPERFERFGTLLNSSEMTHSPRAVFEQSCGKRNSLDYLRSRDFTYLTNGNYKQVMKQRGFVDPRWYLRQKNLS